jgi:hypothetical protein
MAAAVWHRDDRAVTAAPAKNRDNKTARIARLAASLLSGRRQVQTGPPTCTS